MKQKYADPIEEEIEMLRGQIDSSEIETLMYLKGFNRKNLREWNKKGLIDFSIRY